jgi:spore maturation protein CgeB
MHVLLIGQTHRRLALANFRWLADTERAVRALGHASTACAFREEWISSGAVARMAQRWLPDVGRALTARAVAHQAAFERRLIAHARRLRPDLVVVLKGEHLSADTLAAVKHHARGPMVAWWVDDPWRFPDAVARLPVYDQVYVFDRSYLEPLRAVTGRPVHFLPCACDELVYRPMPLGARDQRRWACDVSFVAWCYPEREALVRELCEAVELAVWGGGWDAFAGARTPSGVAMVRGRSISPSTAARIYNASKVGLNVHAQQTRQGGLNTRAFELPASGTCQLVDRVPGLEELLTPGEEVVCYNSPEQARALARELVADPTWRRRVAQRGRERVLAEHTYTARMRRLCELSRAT